LPLNRAEVYGANLKKPVIAAIVVRKNSLISTAGAYAEKINQLSPLVVQNIKSGFYVTGSPPRQIITLEGAIAKIVRHSKDYRGGTLAFRERRKPVWNIEKSCHQLLSMKSRIGLLFLL